jgi:hypothetical protein
MDIFLQTDTIVNLYFLNKKDGFQYRMHSRPTHFMIYNTTRNLLVKCCVSESAWIRTDLALQVPDRECGSVPYPGAWKFRLKLTNNPCFLPFKWTFLTFASMFFDLLGTGTYFKRIFQVKISLLMTSKSNQDSDPDPRGSALVFLPESGSPLR